MNVQNKPLAADETRILIVSDAAPSRNGVGAYYQDLCEIITPLLSQVEFLCPRIVDGKWQAGLALPLPGDKTQKLCFPNYWKMKSTMKTLKPHVVVVASPGVYGFCAAHIAKHLNIPFVTGFHTSFEHITELYWGKSLQGKLIEGYFKVSNQYLFKRTALVLGNSESILQQAKKMGAGLTRLIGTPIAGDFLSPEPQQHSGHLKSLLFAGRLAKEKNIQSIIDAARDFPAMNFSIAGDGPMREEVELACNQSPNLQYLGWLERKQLREKIDEHDALLLPSHYETFGTIALEAMAREKLVVVSSGCGISLWPALADGLTVIKENHTLSQTLFDLAKTSTSQKQNLAKEGRLRALALNKTVATEWLQVFSDVIAKLSSKEKSH